MKFLLTCFLFFVLTGCGMNQGVQRSYIISQSENEQLSQEENRDAR